jgi:hypothetical protein
MEQRADDASQPARMIGPAANLDDVHAMLARQAGSERQHAGGRRVVPRADEQGVETAEAHKLPELRAGSVRDDDLVEVDAGRAQEHVGVVQQAFCRATAFGPRPRLVVDRNEERHAERLSACVLAAAAHESVRIDARVGCDERTR